MNLLNDYKRWERRREAQGRLENIGRARAQDWYDSDDEAVAMLGRAMSLVEAVVDTFGAIDEALGMGSWTCSEAEAIYELMQALGLDEAAERFMLQHAYSDSEEGDLHRLIETVEPYTARWERIELDELDEEES